MIFDKDEEGFLATRVRVLLSLLISLGEQAPELRIIFFLLKTDATRDMI